MTETAEVNTNERPIAAQNDNRGNPVWTSRMSAPDDSCGVCNMVPDRVIPVIFVPGVMGSNLRGVGAGNGTTWTLDSGSSMAAWLTRGAEFRKRTLTPLTMQVDNGGHVPENANGQPREELQRRGWGEVGAMSYETFLVWLETALNDFANPPAGERVALMSRDLQALVGEERPTKEEVGLSYRYRFPVHACGYNWLDSNVNAARRLAGRIDAVIQRYRAEGKRCEKVIVVTHSMGGLVARHCSEVLNKRDKIFGIVHGVMPAIGAAAVYRRFKSGTEGSWPSTAVLGNDAAQMTAVLSTAPGPLQLLPTAEYGNGWLRINDGEQRFTFPKNGDPYSEIYTVRGKWWSMCEDALMNPLNREVNPQRRQQQLDADWAVFKDIIEEAVRPFHVGIARKYHAQTHAFYGRSREHLAYGNVTWNGDSGGMLGSSRQADALNAKQTARQQLGTWRNVAAPLGGSGWATGENQTYTISEAEEEGDGTVPLRSGEAARSSSKSFLRVSVGHEPAYKHSDGAENLRACRFTLRAIVKLAQQVNSTSLKYE